MRVTTDLWASALVRRVFGAGGFAAVLKRGAGEAGAAFLLVRDRFGSVALLGPAPQTSYDSARPDERLFVRIAPDKTAEQLDARIEREKRFDPDIWVVEIEVGSVPIEELVSIRD